MKFNYITIKKLVRISIVLLMVCFVMFLKIDNVKANINPAINFTGKITNTDGTEISDGNYNVSFGLYASSTGSSAIWSEDLTVANCFSATISNVNGTVYTYNNDSNENTLRLGQYLTNSSATGSVLIIDYNTTDNTITVASGSPVWIVGQSINNRPYIEGGVININLGSINDLSGVDFYQKLYLEVVFNGETMQPRKVLTSVAQAFESARIGGKTESELAGLFENEQITGEWSFDNILNIATSSVSTALTVTQTGAGDLINLFDGGNEVFTITDGGFVGIGTTSPGYLLDVYGQGNFDELCLSGSCIPNWGAAGVLDGSASAGQVAYWSADTTLAGENQLAVIRGGTGIGTYAIGDIIYANATNTLSRLSTSTAGSILQLDLTTGLPSYVSTSSLNIAISDTTGTLQIARGGTGLISYNAGDLIYASSDNNLSTLASSTDGYILTLSNGYPAWAVNNDGVVNYGQEGSLTFYSSSGTTATGTTNSLLYWDDINSRLGIGTTSPTERLFIDGNIMVNGDILSYASSSVGSAGVRMYNGYFENLDVTNMTIGSTTVSGAVSNVFTINSDNSTADTEYSYLAFERGTVIPNALLTWNSTDDRFEMNFPLYLESNNFLTLGNVGIGTTTPSSALTIGDNNQFTVTSAGVVDAFSLTLENALATNQGGTGKNLWTQYAIPYLTDTTTFGEIGIGSANYLLSVNAEANGYTWVETGSVGVDTKLSKEEVEDYAGELIASSTGVHTRITVSYDDIDSSMDFTVDDDLNNYSWTNIGTSHLTPTRGGTGIGTYVTGDILYASEDNVLSRLSIGSSSEILMITGGLPSWASASSSGVGSDYLVAVDSGASADYIGNASTTGVIRTTAPLSYTDGVNHITLGITADSIGNTQLAFDTGQNLTTVSSPTFAGITVNGNIVISGEIDGVDISSASSTWDTAVSWGNHSDAGYLTLTTWYATTTDALSEGSNNLYWTNERFDTRLSATSSLSNIISLSELSQIGTIATGTWNADVIGVAYGGTGATTVTGARENLDLDEVYKFGINATGTNGEIWQSDGDGRGHWVTPDSIDGKKSKFVGITSATTNGIFATGTLSGYVAANDICNSEYDGSHFCRTYDIIVSIEQDDISSWGNDTMSAWIAEGPPGYTSDSNDCKGWKDSDSSVLGAYWKFNSTGGGAGWLIHCGNQLPIACCSWQ